MKNWLCINIFKFSSHFQKLDFQFTGQLFFKILSFQWYLLHSITAKIGSDYGLENYLVFFIISFTVMKIWKTIHFFIFLSVTKFNYTDSA